MSGGGLGGPRRWIRSKCKLRSTELICRKSGSASSSSGPTDRRGVSARAGIVGDGDGDEGDSSSIDETLNLFTPRSRRASSVSLRERLPVAVEPVSLRSSSSGSGGGYWRSIVWPCCVCVCAVVHCYGGRAGGDAAAAGAALTQADSCSEIGPCDARAPAALEPARRLVRWKSIGGRNGPCAIAAAPHAVILSNIG